ncbi:hypothetical protein BFC18_04060 [Alteromonas confluentis]|uniref:DUF3025 domain-containing protein n=2 Tax=Alteromonas confluentis TaxID=1656094 RepID=A0A1E7ZFH5_9ALTE|nr:hypothetical protein BFC18_04060 [Alteromonas confluentis]
MNSTAVSWSSAINHPELVSPIKQLLCETGLTETAVFPQPDKLMAVTNHWHNGNWSGPEFKGQSTFSDDDGRYYEEIIFQDNVLPTRESNWHDFFNALIWMQFPRTKGLLNRMHVEDIAAHGVHPRTASRNRITHFDECGVVLAVPERLQPQGRELLYALAHHNWIEIMLEKRANWGDVLYPFIFGHANLEMLLEPFIGLTGKWLAVTVPDDFNQMSFQQQCHAVDTALFQRFTKTDVFSVKGHLHPLPLLGVPGWYSPQNLTFYQNTDYFRPLIKQKTVGELLP